MGAMTVSGALSGIRILSTAVNVPGPVAAAILRDMGAAVVKLEPPGGDPLAALAPPWYAALCARIDVQRIDLKRQDGRARLDDLLAAADVLVTSSRPGSLQRLGLSWGEIHDRHPRVCHVAIVGYASPRADLAGHDLTYQAEAGLVTPPALPRSLIADLAGAQRAVSAALELLFVRERTGAAGYAEVALAECANLFAAPLRHGLTSPGGPLGGADPAYRVHPSRDGWVALAALEPQFRELLSRELEIDLADRTALERVLLTRSAGEWEKWGHAHGLPLAAVKSSG
jgi:crotonobetainyl-CoA:carnitine CoA-transferase CaiB-like acyl-CoA transferase